MTLVGLHRLVGRDHQKTLCLELDGQFGEVARSHHVVEHRLAWVLLHDADVLEGGCVKHDLGAMAFEDMLQLVAVPYISHQRQNPGRKAHFRQLVLQFENGIFITIQQNGFVHAEPGYLPTDFRTDGTASSGDQNILSLEILE